MIDEKGNVFELCIFLQGYATVLLMNGSAPICDLRERPSYNTLNNKNEFLFDIYGSASNDIKLINLLKKEIIMGPQLKQTSKMYRLYTVLFFIIGAAIFIFVAEFNLQLEVISDQVA